MKIHLPSLWPREMTGIALGPGDGTCAGTDFGACVNADAN